MKKYIYLAAFAASLLLAIYLFREARQLRSQVRVLEEGRRRVALAAIDPGWCGVSEGEKMRMLGIYQDIAQAYTTRDIMAMRIAMLKLPPVNDHLTWPISPQIEKPLHMIFDNEFRHQHGLIPPAARACAPSACP